VCERGLEKGPGKEEKRTGCCVVKAVHSTTNLRREFKVGDGGRQKKIVPQEKREEERYSEGA